MPSKYKCWNCGSKNYTLESIRKTKDIWDGPFRIIGYIDSECAYVRVWCNNCQQELDPILEDVKKHFAPIRGFVKTI